MTVQAALLAAAIIIVFSACTRGPTYLGRATQKSHVPPPPDDLKLPVGLWDKLEKSGGGRETPVPEFASLNIYLIEKTPGVLKQGSRVLELPQGGSEIDLADFLSGANGTFFIGVEFGRSNARKAGSGDEGPLHVFHLSDARVRRIGTRRHGSGCDVYADISGFFREAMATDGIRVNTTDGRHVSLLAGTFFFATSSNGKLHLSHLKIRDSRYPKLQCQRT